MSAAGIAQVDRTAFSRRLPAREPPATDRYDVGEGDVDARNAKLTSEQLFELAVDDALEGAPPVGASEVGNLEVVGGERALGPGQGVDGSAKGRAQVHPLGEALLQKLVDRRGLGRQGNEVGLGGGRGGGEGGEEPGGM